MLENGAHNCEKRTSVKLPYSLHIIVVDNWWLAALIAKTCTYFVPFYVIASFLFVDLNIDFHKSILCSAEHTRYVIELISGSYIHTHVRLYKRKLSYWFLENSLVSCEQQSMCPPWNIQKLFYYRDSLNFPKRYKRIRGKGFKCK